MLLSMLDHAEWNMLLEFLFTTKLDMLLDTKGSACDQTKAANTRVMIE